MQTPSQGTYDSITGRSPGQQSQLARFNAASQAYDVYTYANGAWSPSNPIVAVGEGVFVIGPTNTQPCVTILCPSNINVVSYDGQPVSVPYTAIASNYCGAGAVVVTCDPPSPGPFPVGATTVTCTASVGANY